MSEPFLIAHVVRGEAVFDIASKMKCPMCEGQPICAADGIMCSECDGEGFWWIIPTSGHRARPFEHWPLKELLVDLSYPGDPEYRRVIDECPAPPEGWPDHYPRPAPRTPAKVSNSSEDLLKELDL